ncbi:hypothetical protein [Actinomadura gamaensis]|uniref:Uncharacterized protein n=1 Tax=Actinomadura gamaensis TaxID=1763541 RepID=A0ABV9UAF3_9ACTN
MCSRRRDDLPDPEALPDPALLTPAQRLALQLWAYNKFLDAIVTESQRAFGRAEDPEAVRVYGDIVERAGARRREYERDTKTA